ncbi:MAG: hypothetical protein ABF876_05470 [Acetobacter aceti]
MKTENVAVPLLKAVQRLDEIGPGWVGIARTDVEGRWRWHSEELERAVPALVDTGVITTAQKRQRWDNSFILLARRPQS